MKIISTWAKKNKWSARILIVFLYVLINFLGIKIGVLLSEVGVLLPTGLLFLTIFFFTVAVALYPFQSLKSKLSSSGFYIRQKACDFTLITGTFCMIVYLVNHSKNPTGTMQANAAVIVLPVKIEDTSINKYKTIGAFAASMTDESGKTLKWKVRKMLLKKQVEQIKEANNLTSGEKTTFIILSIIIALVALLGIAGLACSLSCSGAEGAALLVGIVGTAAVIYLLIIVIKSINRKYKTL